MALIGASMGTVVLLYTGASVVSTFLITAAAFGALSLFGYTTKKDLTGIGSFLIMGVIGLIIASVVNMFLQSGHDADDHQRRRRADLRGPDRLRHPAAEDDLLRPGREPERRWAWPPATAR